MDNIVSISVTKIFWLSELLQHEYDHLNGILAVSKAIDGESFSYSSI